MAYIGNQITTTFPSSVTVDKINDVTYVPNPPSGQITGRRNLIINGGMNVAQRATSETGLGASSKYSTVDRFNHAFDATAGRLTSSQVASGLNGFGNALKLDCTTADTSVAAGELFIIQQRIEGQNLQQLKKGTSDAEQLTLSFYAKVVGSSTDIVVELEDADNSRHVAKLFTLTTSWARYTYTFPADTTGTLDDDNASSFLVNFWLHAGSTYNSGTLATSWASKTEANRAVGADSFFSSTDNELFLTGIQLEVGEVTNPIFEHRSFIDTWNDCQRYCTVYNVGGNQVHDENLIHNGSPLPGSSGHVDVANRAEYFLSYPIKRATPTITVFNPTELRWLSTGNNVQNGTSDVTFPVGLGIQRTNCFQSVGSGLTTSHHCDYWGHDGGSTYAKLVIDSEL